MFTQLRRITSSGSYIPEIDGVRFIAISMVLFQHLHEKVQHNAAERYPAVEGSTLDQILKSGGLGVMIFFALSGYILYGILKGSFVKGSHSGLKGYYLRRITRLEPPYILVTTAIFAALALGLYHGSGKFLGQGNVPLWVGYLTTIGYLNGILFGTPPSVNPPGWTLEIEVQFYVLAPLLTMAMLWFKRWQARAMVAIVVILPLTILNMPAMWANPHIHYSLLAWFPYFLVGVAVNEIINRNHHGLPPGRGIIDVLAVVALLLLPFQDGRLAYFGRCLCIGVFLSGALAGTWLRRLLQYRWITNIGGMCYTIYLVHLPCMELLTRVTTKFKLNSPYFFYLLCQAVIVLPIVFVVATIAFVLVERPCMNKNWPFELWAHLKLMVTQPSVVPAKKQSLSESKPE